MTITALYAFVFAFQFELGFGVIKLKIAPGAFPVTTVADFSELAFVGFVILVAIYAFMLGFMVFFLRLVATLTLHGEVTASKNKIRLVMIKRLFVQHHDIRASTNVLPVTYTTFLVFDIGNAAVKAFFCFYILFNVFVVVAIQAQYVLFRLFKKLVALVTVVLKLCMGLTQLPRH
jgi:hypothetical protein